jgi:glycosyltransferase involved in cell wall biosynthesis
VFLEAMAAGLPVVAFDFGGPTDIITPGVDGLLIKRDAVEDLVQVLGDLATTPNQAAELGNGAWRAATQRFSWTAISKRYFAAYESVLAERGVRAS